MAYKLTFTKAAEQQMEFFYKNDYKLWEAIDAQLDHIETGDDRGRLRQNIDHISFRFTHVMVPGRDDTYTIVWREHGYNPIIISIIDVGHRLGI